MAYTDKKLKSAKRSRSSSKSQSPAQVRTEIETRFGTNGFEAISSVYPKTWKAKYSSWKKAGGEVVAMAGVMRMHFYDM